MKASTRYRQCKLEKLSSPTSSAERVTYIPARFAQVGRRLRLKLDDGQWDEGWVVQLVGSTMRHDELPDTHRAVRHHRRTTGDSLPRRK